MPYRIRDTEAVPVAIKRIALEQISRARDELVSGDLEAAEAVHQVRKRFKKLRGLLRLIRPAMESGRFRAENRFFRDQGRVLAPARDDQVMLDTLDMLDKAGLEIDSNDLETLRQLLVDRRDVHLKGGDGSLAERMASVASALDRYPEHLINWELRRKDFSALRSGLKHSYRNGRKALKAVRRQAEDDRFHEWRKRVKDHWYHSRLLQGIWPGVMKAYRGELEYLSDLLGDDHDLAVFRRNVELRSGGVLAAAARDGLLRCVDRQQQQLRGKALVLGDRIYAEKPKRFIQRWERYWFCWRLTG